MTSIDVGDEHMLTARDRALLARYAAGTLDGQWGDMLQVKQWLCQADDEIEAAWAGACA